MIDNRLWEMFPETPDSFRNMVKQTVADQLTVERKRNVFRTPRAATVAVILVLIAGTTVGAANISKLKTYLAKWGYKVPEENVVSYEEKEQTDMVQGNSIEVTSDTDIEGTGTEDNKDSMTYEISEEKINNLKEKYASLADSEYVIYGFFFEDSDGKRYVDCNNAEGVVRVMSFSGPCSYGVPGVVDGKFTGTYEFAIEQTFNLNTDIIRFSP